jgi:hypothetical protein
MRVEEIKAAIEEFPGAEFVEIRKWVAERDWQIWDREVEGAPRQGNSIFLSKRPSHPSLHFKRAVKFWSARVGLDHRALAVQDGPDFIWVWIGSHDAYKRLSVYQDFHARIFSKNLAQMLVSPA